MKRHAAQRGDRVAFRDASGSVTWSGLEQRTANIASRLADLGVVPGDTVAVYLPNSVAWVESVLAVVRAGAVAVPVSIDSKDGEVSYRLSDSACRVVVTLPEKVAVVEAVRAETSALEAIVTVGGEGLLTLEDMAMAPGTMPACEGGDIDAPSFIVYTSGTTGQPKGVLLTQRSMLWVTASCWAPMIGLGPDDTMLAPLPLFHSYALNLCVVSIVATGASIYLMERFSTGEATRLLRGGGFTLFPGVPTIFHYLIETARKEGDFLLSNLRLCVTAGAILPAALNDEFERRFGVKLLDGYGITETSTMVTMNGPEGGRVPGSCGLPIVGLAVRVVNPETMRDCDPGEEGELIVRGPNVMTGYLNKPEETAKAIRNGWYHTGDLARSDRNGFLTITGRIKELIIRGGQNIAPAEVEEVVAKLECIVDCAVVGLPHEGLGEIVGLFVIPRDSGFDQDVVIEHCRQHLSSYKVPTVIHAVEAIPRTGSGKIIRYQLRDAVKS
ncbi:class I adenylate-forming enzyme family protein [Novosphingobium malaysiense]|uniref:class I adenylate-forming enzyme family protein n=1 Tax=Novosphingobium malaysiense TaxID=1348853 RepID=UPI0018CDEA75|nr:class I adenylate-forming enzyme family protein [Novosphingobium malaysiense]